jgi:hypothetical protein
MAYLERVCSASTFGPDRLPILELRQLAADAGWNTDPFTSDEAFHLTNASIRRRSMVWSGFWGRQHADRTEIGVQAVPLIDIPRAHFSQYTFAPMNLFGRNAKNFLIFTGQIGKQPREFRGQIFQDIHADRGQLIVSPRRIIDVAFAADPPCVIPSSRRIKVDR